MRILLLTEAYAPEPVVGAFRAAKVARALTAAGHTVDVLAARVGPARIGESSRAPRVGRITPLPGPRQLYLALRRVLPGRERRRPGTDAGPEGSGQERRFDGGVDGRGPGRGSLLRRLALSVMWLPDDQQGLIPVAVAAAWRRHRREPYDLIYTTAPCFSMHIAGRILRALLRRPWVAEFRDPWVENASGRLVGLTRVACAIDRRLERGCVRAADAIVTVSEAAGALYRHKLGPAGAGKVVVALNGIDGLEPPRSGRAPGPVRVVFAGSLYPPRDPLPLLDALARVGHASAAPPLEISFVGSCRTYAGRDLAESAGAVGLRGNLKIMDWQPQEEVRRLLREADLLLLPAQGWQLQIPNKLFDYLGLRAPVLALAERGSETARMLEHAGGHFLAFTDDTGALANQAAAAVAAAATGARASENGCVATWTTDRQMQGLVSELDARFGRNAATSQRPDPRRVPAAAS